ncbi:MAG: MBL fold metallo-hydrolase [Sulfuritalea sp.]|nr:MBL fold metallo-hydrolase [Sulfuritalea sp.]MDP1983805.1 MBL fold metallo-hydrolase [Sulfuritalea sp.]
MPTPLIDYHNGIYAFDAGYVRPLLAAIHLIESEGRAAFVDTANFEVMPQALAALAARGLGPESVDYVILTHIHLDHAGGAGVMMEAFPNAKLVVHPRGARHMIEPTKLMAGVEGVYGQERARRMYGKLIPIAAERIIEAHDNTVLKLGSRELLCIDAPGHAKHHIAIVDRQSSGIFTGDTFGISYRELDVDGKPLIFPSSTPIQFDPDEMRASIERMLSFSPEAVYLTHFSRLAPPAELGRKVLELLDQYVAITLAASEDEDKTARIREGLTALLLQEAHAHGCRLSDAEILDLWHLDLELNAQGLAYWLEAQDAA